MTALVARSAGSIRQRPLTWFFVLSCALSWWGCLLYLPGWSPIPIASFGPFLAAMVVLSVSHGRAGVRDLLGRMVRWRVPFRGYALAVGLPVLVTAAAIAVTVATGASAPSLAGWTDVLVVLPIVLLIPGFGGAWEEPGFRGYALPRLEQRYGWIAGPLLLGAFHVFWHLPLFLTGDILISDVGVIIAASIVFAAVMHTARDSILIAMLLHATNNAVSGEFASQLFTGAAKSHLGWLTAAGWWVVAGVTIAVRAKTSRRQPIPVPAELSSIA